MIASIPGASSMGKPAFVIVGVVKDFRQERPPSRISPAMYVYVPLGMSSQTFAIRTRVSDPSSLLPHLRSMLLQMDPALPPPLFETYYGALDRALWRERLYQQVLGIFALVAVALSAFGMYGVIAYTVTQRTHEIGIRVTLGAQKSRILTLVMRQAAVLAGAGILVGLAAAATLTPLLQSVLYETPSTDSLTFIVVSCLLAAITLAATALPARRAARTDPAEALRCD
jgi:putative ABC transport system permease protein